MAQLILMLVGIFLLFGIVACATQWTGVWGTRYPDPDPRDPEREAIKKATQGVTPSDDIFVARTLTNSKPNP